MDKFRRYRSLCQTRFDAAVEKAGQMRLKGMTLRQIAKRQKCGFPHGRTPPDRARELWLKNAADSYELWVARELSPLEGRFCARPGSSGIRLETRQEAETGHREQRAEGKHCDH